jgi:CheY-like chemotaxis protein
MSRILIVDDEASICYAFREFLTDEGHHVVVAASAEEGLDLAERARPDAVVLDVRLPGMDGLSAIPRFRSLIGNAPIVVMTAFGTSIPPCGPSKAAPSIISSSRSISTRPPRYSRVR